MSTTGQRLVQLSGLPSGTAGEHLTAISQSGVTAGERLLSYSSLASATAGQHLLDEGAVTGIFGSLSALELQDLFSALGTSGDGIVSGALAVTELGVDSLSANGSLFVSATLSALEPELDQLSSPGFTLLRGDLIAVEFNDGLFATGTVEWAVSTGTVIGQEQGEDLFTASGQLLLSGLADANDQPDIASYTGQVLVRGAVGAQEPIQDNLSADVDVVISGQTSASESEALDSFYSIEFGLFGQWQQVIAKPITTLAKADISTVKPKIEATTTSPRAEFSISQARASYGYLSIGISAFAKQFKLSYELGKFNTGYTFSDNLLISESFIREFAKGLADQTELTDQHAIASFRGTADLLGVFDEAALNVAYVRQAAELINTTDLLPVFDLAYARQDIATLIEITTTLVEKPASDQVTTTDQYTAEFSKPEADQLAANDSFVYQAVFYRSFSDVISLLDIPTVSNVVDALGLGDDYALTISQGFFDTVTLADLASISAAYIRPETAALSDSSDVSLGLEKTEGLLATDAFQATVIYSRAFSDAFAVDDTAGVGSDNQAVKQNVLFMSEEHSHEFSKSLADNFTFSDVFSRTVSYERTAAESLSLSETVQIFKTSGGSSVLNGGALNTVALNN